MTLCTVYDWALGVRHAQPHTVFCMEQGIISDTVLDYIWGGIIGVVAAMAEKKWKDWEFHRAWKLSPICLSFDWQVFTLLTILCSSSQKTAILQNCHLTMYSIKLARQKINTWMCASISMWVLFACCCECRLFLTGQAAHWDNFTN